MSDTCKRMEPPPPLICNVCDTNEALGVASSCLGAISFAFCRECLEQNAEPIGMCQMLLEDCGGPDGLAEWAKLLRTYHNSRYISILEIPELVGEETPPSEAREERGQPDGGPREES